MNEVQVQGVHAANAPCAVTPHPRSHQGLHQFTPLTQKLMRLNYEPSSEPLHMSFALFDSGMLDSRCRAQSARINQPEPDPGSCFRVKVLETFELFPLRSASEDGNVDEHISHNVLIKWF